jgi:hypothetical protein
VGQEIDARPIGVSLAPVPHRSPLPRPLNRGFGPSNYPLRSASILSCQSMPSPFFQREAARKGTRTDGDDRNAEISWRRAILATVWTGPQERCFILQCLNVTLFQSASIGDLF